MRRFLSHVLGTCLSFVVIGFLASPALFAETLTTVASFAYTGIASVPTGTLLGRTTAGTGAAETITPGTGVITWLVTPTSANLASAITNETGSGLAVFATSPALTTPNIGAATANSVTAVASLTLQAGSGAALALGGNGGTEWSITSGGHFVASLADNTFDIGASGATRPRTVYIGTSIVLPVVAASALGTCNGGAEGTLKTVSDANSATFNATVAGSGSNHVLAYCNGTNWTVH